MVEFGVCFIYAEILLNSSLCFAHVGSSFKVQEMAQKLYKGTTAKLSLSPSTAWAVGVGPFVLIFPV